MNKRILKALGPGILFASTAIGVSHLVQATSAGAKFGFGLLWAVILANIFKYPFFEFGSRYANATGTSIIDGYKKLGKPILWGYFLITLCSMFFVASAVGLVTVGFFINLFNIHEWPCLENPILWTSCIVFVVCVSILTIGQYKVLDGLIKVVGSVLLLSTIMAFVLTLYNGPQERVKDFIAPALLGKESLLFLIPLMGWMPTAVDLSTWNSLWTIERIKETGYKPTMKETLFDFNLGYIVSGVLSIFFLVIGAFLIYGTGIELPKSAGAFANFVVTLYTKSIGNWSYLIIAAAAFSIMFGTCIAVFDGYARAMDKTSTLLFSKKTTGHYRIILIILALGAFGIIYHFHDKPTGFKSLINLATSLSFLIAPAIAIINFKLVGAKHIGEHSPKPWLKTLSYLGIIFLTGFSIFYLYYANEF